MNIMSGGWDNCAIYASGTGQVFISPDGTILETNSVSGARSAVHYYFPVYPGQITQVSVKVKTLSGVFGIAIDYFSASGSSLGNGGNTGLFDSPTYREVKLVGQALPNAAYARVTFGQWTALSGHSLAKDPQITVFGGPMAVPTLAYALVHRPRNGPWTIRDDFSRSLIRGAEWDAATKRLALDVDVPTVADLTPVRKPLIFLTDPGDQSTNLVARAQYQNSTRTPYITWHDIGNGTIVDIEEVNPSHVFTYVCIIF